MLQRGACAFQSQRELCANVISGTSASDDVMQKGAGWGAEYPDDVRNGEWEYQVFTADKAVNEKANLKACFGCHKPKASADYLFTLEQLKAAK